MARGREETDRVADRRSPGRLVATISHELRNPIQSLEVALSLLEPDLPDRQEGTVRAMRRQLDLAKRLLNDLLELSKLDGSDVRLSRELVDVGQLVRDCARDHLWRFDGDGVALEVHAGDGVKAQVDRHRVSQIVQNLLVNAVRHTPSGGCVHLSCRQREGGVRLEVRDTGVGVDPAHADQLFEPFFRGGTSLRREASLGIGLAIVAGFAEAHGGYAEAHSEGPGLGASFVVWLPE